MVKESNSIKAINLTKKVFENIYGNLGLLHFSVEKLAPTNGSPSEESKKWDITCTFYESTSSTKPTKYKVLVDLSNNIVKLEKLSEVSSKSEPDRKTYQVTEQKNIKQEK